MINLDFLQKVYWRNTVQDYLITLGIIMLGLLLVRLFKKYIIAKLKILTSRTKSYFDDYLVDSMDRFGIPALNFAVIYFALDFLRLSRKVDKIVTIATTIIITILVIRILSSAILLLLQANLRRQAQGEEKVKQMGGLMLIINSIIWILGIVFLIDNLGYNVSTIIAGLGIGGIAIALAAQNILGDVFNYFVIFFDRPFEVGDFIIIDTKMGVVDYIGLKTTRIKSLSGEMLVFANSDLTGSRIHNYKNMQQRRVVFKIQLDYKTPVERLAEVSALLKQVVEEQSPVRFDRAHFMNYGSYGLEYEIVYFVLDADYTVYMNVHQRVNIRIYEELQKRGLAFALPTQYLYISGMEKDTDSSARMQ
ncbi:MULTISPECIES: mechanosensitive ion channel family protein [unclassified Siphonobacter]|uniref:mechanosensitive ion channel family protein n=1 Tax=unclassified Siphonobacter TaxID=2635712 RepID=UPI001E3929F5|nr:MULTISPECIES: mechanosensitive ion channel domain-containing protein [unclassified Siphonobacter]MDQ1086936.1 small-conductance mechanosensitive channel [Siphonobacter sp. SORGH_AS_1065]MDR6193046.1 small-conductance mechanosensitive channel [Siphonobacter sp. SORGH_AS_0500]